MNDKVYIRFYDKDGPKEFAATITDFVLKDQFEENKVGFQTFQLTVDILTNAMPKEFIDNLRDSLRHGKYEQTDDSLWELVEEVTRCAEERGYFSKNNIDKQ